jgi:iron complex outermembrane receptor protein
VGSVRTRGVEIEYSAMPVSGLRIDGSFSYTDAVATSFKNAQCYTGQTVAQGCVDLDGSGPSTTTGQDLSGRQMPNAPRYKLNIGGTYDILLPSLPFDAFVQADYNYQSKVNFDLLNNPLTVQKAYGLFSGSVGVNRDGYRVSFYVNNLFDQHYASNIYVASGGTAGLLAQYLDRNSRRYFGVRAGYKF